MTSSETDGAPGGVLVTGGSRGIGLELARRFAADGHPLYLVARDAGALEEARRELEEGGSPAVRCLSVDLSGEGAARHVHRELAEASPPVDVVVNNAGFSTHGPFHRSDAGAQVDMARVMVEVPTELSRRFLAGMVERDRGGILNVASTAAFQPGPRQAVYFAAKAYLVSFTQAVAYELDDTSVRISVLCPGPTRTDFQERAGMDEVRLGGSGPLTLMSPGRAAEVGYRGWRGGQRVVIPGLVNRVGATGARLMPDSLAMPVVDWLQRPPGRGGAQG